MKNVVCLVCLACVAFAQPRPKNTYRAPGATTPAAPRVVSPEVHADRTITFRLRAPQANQVALMWSGSKPMTKDSDGLWSLTVGPAEPEIYTYTFTVDGVRILDPGTSNIKNGRTIDASFVEVPGAVAPRFDE